MSAFSLDVPHGAPIVGPGRFRHLGGHARLQRAQEPRRLSVVRSGARRRQPHHRRQCPIRPRQRDSALGSLGSSAQRCASSSSHRRQSGHDGRWRLHRQRGLVPPGVPAGAQDGAGPLHGPHLAGLRRVRRSRQPVCSGVHVLVHRRIHHPHHARRRRRPGGRAHPRHAPRTRKMVSVAAADAAGPIQRHGHRRLRSRFGGPRPRHRQFPRRWPRAVDHRRGQQRLEPGRADGYRGWVPLLASEPSR